MALGVHAQLAALERSRIDLLGRGPVLRGGPPQHRFYALDQQALRERLSDEIVGAHLEPEQLVDLLILGGEENHRHIGLLPQAAQRFHAVHAGHLDVQDGEVRRRRLEAVERGSAVRVGHDAVALGFERNRNRS